uniref:hypothetical protein n=1 Tax=Anaerostipes caccae TaxID=105841 RepID=UPI003AB9116F
MHGSLYTPSYYPVGITFIKAASALNYPPPSQLGQGFCHQQMKPTDSEPDSVQHYSTAGTSDPKNLCLCSAGMGGMQDIVRPFLGTTISFDGTGCSGNVRHSHLFF